MLSAIRKYKFPSHLAQDARHVEAPSLTSMAKAASKQHDAAATTAFVAWVFVLGDFGRSPRMQYHTQSLSSQPSTAAVHVIAYGGAAPMESLRCNPKVHISTLPEVPKLIMRLPGVLRLAFKVLHQLLALAWLMLVHLPRPSAILMQNPPAIPAMLLCWLAAKRHGARLIIDWHNYGWSIMALKHNPRGPLVQLAKSHELAWGRAADEGFCVTAAMQHDLRERWGVKATVLYDRPPRHFRRTPLPAIHDLFVRLGPSLAGQPSCSAAAGQTSVGGGTAGQSYRDFAALEAPTWGAGRTVVTTSDQPGTAQTTSSAAGPEGKAKTAAGAASAAGEVGEGTAVSGASAGASAGALGASWRYDRPAVVISSTSWTPDEDFGVLLEALVLYEQAVVAQATDAGPDQATSASTSVTTDAVEAAALAAATARASGASSGDGLGTSSAAGGGSGAGGRAAVGEGRLPPLLVLITGRGPQRDMYLRRIAQLQLRNVAIRSLWLEASDYPLLLGAADLGVCLHASSSGLDLPMKVVDMFGSGLPVCALAYNCIHELVEDGETGLLFSSPQQLSEQLQALLRGVPSRTSAQLQHLQRQVASKEQGLRWEENWNKVAWPVINGSSS